MVEVHVFRETEAGIEFLLLKRSENEIYAGLWQMVSGKIEEGEKAYEAALREIKEETGLVPEKLWVAPNVNHFYSHEHDFISVLPVFAAKISSATDVILCDEHCEYKWVKPEEAKKLLTWEGQIKSVSIITEYYINHIEHLNFVEIKF